MATIPTEQLICRVPIFSALTQPQAAQLAEHSQKLRFKRGETIVEQGKRSNSLYIILSGRVRVISSAATQGAREVILAVLHAGDAIGEMTLIDNEPHSASVIADSLTDVLMISGEVFRRLIPEIPTCALSVMMALVKRLRAADRKIESLALHDVYGRVSHTLLELSEVGVDGVRMIRGRVSRQDVAKMVGASREMVGRVMRELENDGLISARENGLVLLLDHVQQLGQLSHAHQSDTKVVPATAVNTLAAKSSAKSTTKSSTSARRAVR